MKCYPLAKKEYALLVVIFIAGYLFTELQYLLIPEATRPFSYLLAVTVLLLLFFSLVKPERPYELARFLAVLLGAIVAVIIVIEDIIIRHTLSYKLAVVLGGAIICPLVAGSLYGILRKKP
jgi:hypothetical protein